jgi:hypothetical protein
MKSLRIGVCVWLRSKNRPMLLEALSAPSGCGQPKSGLRGFEADAILGWTYR